MLTKATQSQGRVPAQKTQGEEKTQRDRDVNHSLKSASKGPPTAA